MKNNRSRFMIDIEKHIKKSIEAKEAVLKDKNFLQTIITVSEIIVKAFKSGNKLLCAGNGGSSCDAEHLASELVVKFYFERPALNAIALTANTAINTAIGNDFSNSEIFARQIQANAQEGDIFVAISTSGNSINIINAAKEAKKKNVTVIGLTGKNHCKLDELCDYTIKVPSQNTPTIQEVHTMICHIICAEVEDMMFNEQDFQC